MAFKQDRRLQKWYEKYNKWYWDDKLPKGTRVGWDDELDEKLCALHNGIGLTLEEDATVYRLDLISLDPKVHAGARDERLSLLHEMCHVALFPYNKHGIKFKNEKRRIAMLGALDDLW